MHTLSLDVTIIDETTNLKNLAFSIDGVFLFNYEFTSDIDSQTVNDNVTGFRVWGGVDIAFYSIDIEPITS